MKKCFGFWQAMGCGILLIFLLGEEHSYRLTFYFVLFFPMIWGLCKAIKRHRGRGGIIEADNLNIRNKQE